MQRIQSYRDLLVWQRGMRLVTNVYRESVSFPSDERFGLTSQIRRAAVSVPSNIAEGWGLGTTKHYLSHLDRARASLCEVETQLSIALNLDYLSEERHDALLSETDELGQMLLGLMRSLRSRIGG